MTRQLSPKDFLVGAAVGGVLGTVTALLIAPKSGKKLREDIYDTYCDISDRTHDIASNVSKKGRSLAKTVSSQKEDWTEKAECLMDDIKGWIHPNGQDHHSAREFIIGGVAGGVLGAVAALLLAPKPGDELRQDIAEAYEDAAERTHEIASEARKRGKTFVKKAKTRAGDWLDVAQNVLSFLAEETQDRVEDLEERAEEAYSNSKIKNIMDWASLGVRVLQQVKNRR